MPDLEMVPVSPVPQYTTSSLSSCTRETWTGQCGYPPPLYRSMSLTWNSLVSGTGFPVLGVVFDRAPTMPPLVFFFTSCVISGLTFLSSGVPSFTTWPPEAPPMPWPSPARAPPPRLPFAGADFTVIEFSLSSKLVSLAVCHSPPALMTCCGGLVQAAAALPGYDRLQCKTWSFSSIHVQRCVSPFGGGSRMQAKQAPVGGPQDFGCGPAPKIRASYLR